MQVYLGSTKVRVNLNGILYNLNYHSRLPATVGVKLLTSDGYLLTDSNGVIITTKEEIK